MPLNPIPSYPTALDSLPDPTTTTWADDDGFEHDLLHQKVNGIAEALEIKVGIGAGAPSAGKVLAGTGAGASGWTASPAVSTIGIGVGDLVSSYFNPAPQVVDIRVGTSASPDLVAAPTVKVSRTQKMTLAALAAAGGSGSDGGDFAAALIASNAGVASNEVQPVGLYGHSSSVGAYDACGVYGVGRQLTGGTGFGIGGFFTGRRDVNTAKAEGLEAVVQNLTATAGSFNTSGASDVAGVHITCLGNADSGVAIAITNGFGRQFKVGLGFNSQVTGGLTGPVADQSIRDDGNATTSIQINGSHSYRLDLDGGTFSAAAIRLKQNAGIFGRSTTNVDWGLIGLYADVVRVGGAGATVALRASGADEWYCQTGFLFPATDNTKSLGFEGARLATLALAGYMDFKEMVDPAAPAADRAYLYCRDNGAGKTQIVARFSSGAIQVIATQP